MDYNLAKELKDARFPQASDGKGTLRKGGAYLFPEGTTLATSQKKITKLAAYAPTLEELIEAVLPLATDNQDFHLEHMHDRWGASIDCYKNSDWITGKTPTEAVARLWLTLNLK